MLPDKNTTTLTVSNTTNATENVEVKVTTGCVYPVENVHFEWFYYKVGDLSFNIAFFTGSELHLHLNYLHVWTSVTENY